MERRPHAPTRPGGDGRADPAPPGGEAADDLRRRYLDLLKQALLNETGLGAEAAYFFVRDALESGREVDDLDLYDVSGRLSSHFERVREARESGRYVDREPQKIGFAYTMIGRRRLENVEFCLSSLLADAVPGDLVECGVWRGGAAIFMRAVLAAYGVSDRVVWLADSFAGLPKPEAPLDTIDLSAERRPELVVDLDRVRRNFALFGLLDDQVRFLEGWFADTLPAAPVDRIALLRLDGDLYSSTMTALTALYDRVSPRGYVIVDDYNGLPDCRAAVTDFRAERGVEEPIVEIDWTGVYWRKRG
ncbi:MAG: TylF/MycF/NovP-related O-methyltransferase [Gaiellaceae bacterium]